MTRRSRALLRAFLPLFALCFCYASGGSNDSATTAMPAAVDVPAISNNAPPTIVLASVEAAQVGATFDYQPVTQDPESDTLRFTAINLPSWASFDSTSGRISGTPGSNDAGLYESISITVADATHLVVTAPFSIVVNPALNPALELGSGVASLQWEAPPSKVSGEPLDDLAGYRILYGRSSSDLDHSVMIPDPATTSYQLSTLTPGVWYFAVVAVSADGLEGPPTTFASKSI
jgi:putative Ig domain-containing protein/fibronectin type III domain protein